MGAGEEKRTYNLSPVMIVLKAVLISEKVLFSEKYLVKKYLKKYICRLYEPI